jgi:quinoprotein glucose dehydrogenase
MVQHTARIIPYVLAAVCALTGAALGLGGVWLLSLGGSPFYLVQGATFIVIAALLFVRHPLTLWVYAALILTTLIWALFEVGFDWWPLLPRGAFTVVLGFILLLWTLLARHPVTGPAMTRSGMTALAAAILVSGAVAAVAIDAPSHDLAGKLPARSTATPSTLEAPPGKDKDWTAYGGTSAGQRYSTLDQITPDNVDRLAPAWTFHTGDIRGKTDPEESTYEVTPLEIDGTVYLCTPHDLVFALDAETGAEKWRFDPKINQPSRQSTQHLTCRGLSWFDGTMATAAPGAPKSADCVKRLFLPTVDGRLIALSAATGKPCPGFGGPDGSVDLWRNMPNVKPGSYYSTSPPIVTRDLVIVGGAVNDNVSTTEASGVVRAFDINTGDLVWNFDSGNPTETAPIAPNGTYTENSPNSWSIASYDPTLGLIYIPTGNQPPDQFGGKRSANVEKYSSSVVALNAATGEVVWSFQSTHHDLWDMDVPAQPELIDLTFGGESVPALVETTKQGELFVLDRRTGKPLLPVREVPAPQKAAPGDTAAATQPVSTLSFDPPPLTETSMWGITPFDQLACRIAFRSLRYEGRYTPPSTQGSIIYPGNFGTFNWGGVAVDPEREIVFAMPVYLAFTSQLVPRSNPTERLVTKPDQPPFNENFGAPYAVKMAAFLSPLKLPCQAPPWGYVAGADLTTGQIAWRHVNGTVRDLAPLPLPFKLGVPGIGGPMLTRGGLAFLSGTLDYFARAYDVTTGKQLWESRLPAGGQATPMTYWSKASQRQFVLFVAGGHGSTGTKAGDAIVAYALPKG